MPDTQDPNTAASRKAEVAAKKPRDSRGHFIKNDLLSVEENKTQNDETLIDVKVTNPLHKITALLQDIKKKQSTTIDLKFTVPLIALPVFMLIAFSLGKNAAGVGTCNQSTQTKIGVIYLLKPGQPKTNTFKSNITGLFSLLPFTYPFRLKQDKTQNNRPILIERNNTAVTLTNPKNINMAAYQTRQVFATGLYNACENNLKIENEDDIQLVP